MKGWLMASRGGGWGGLATSWVVSTTSNGETEVAELLPKALELVRLALNRSKGVTETTPWPSHPQGPWGAFGHSRLAIWGWPNHFQGPLR